MGIGFGAAILALGVRLGGLDSGPGGQTVRVVDDTASIAELLNARSSGGEPPLPMDGHFLVREPLDEPTARRLFPSLAGGMVYDPVCYYRRAPDYVGRMKFPEHHRGGWAVRTNSDGMRESKDVAAEKPDLRVLVAGDSHTDGACSNAESFPNQLERLLAQERPDRVVEVLNTGTGGYHLYNYLGVLERYLELDPDIFIVAVYGGNDFHSAVRLERYFMHRPAPDYSRYPFNRLEERLGDTMTIIGAQDLNQEIYFYNNPGDVSASIDTTRSITLEMERIAAEHGIRVLHVYLPPLSSCQPHYFAEALRTAYGALGLGADELNASDRIADRWIEFLRERGLPHADLRTAFRAGDEPYYWRTEHHLNVAGHRKVAEELLPLVRDMIGWTGSRDGDEEDR